MEDFRYVYIKLVLRARHKIPSLISLNSQVTHYVSQEVTGKVLTFRAEYQTLVKLPKTRAIAFGVRTYQR